MYYKIKKHSINVTVLLILAMATLSPALAEKRTTNAQQSLQTKITFQCREMSIDTVLIQLAEMANIDIIKSPKVTGDITVKVTDITLAETLDNILTTYGYTYIETDNMLRVVSLSDLATVQQKLVTKFYRITYADIENVYAALTPLITKRGVISMDKGTNHIIVTDEESKIKEFDEFVAEVDSPTPQVLVEVRIYDITTNESFDIGAEWAAQRNVPLITSDHQNTITKTNENASGEDTFQTTITDTIDTLDPANTGTVIETESTISPPTSSFKNTETDQTSTSSTTRRRKPLIGSDFNAVNGGTLRFGLLNDVVDLEFALNMLRSDLEAKLLANPRVLVLDNETASIQITREIPYTQLTQTQQGGSMTSTEFKNVGVELTVTPHIIIKDRMIRMFVNPKFGIETGEVVNGVPVVDKRETSTTTLVRDGRTIVLSGLRKKQLTTSVKKIPLLGDLPLLGGLFRSTSEEEVTNELIVFITTTIIDQPVLTETEIEQYGLTKISALTK